MVNYIQYLLILLVVCPNIGGLKYDINVASDSRPLIEFVRFGFHSGYFNISISNVTVGNTDWRPDIVSVYNLGFLLHYSRDDSDELPITGSLCLPSSRNTLQRYMLTLRNGTTAAIATIDKGFFTLYFVNCAEDAVSFKMHLEEFNTDTKREICYLTYGLCSMNLMYGVIIVPYSLMVLFWFFVMISRASPRKSYQTLMLPISISKLLGCILGVAMFQDLREQGHSVSGYTVAFFAHHALHQVAMFCFLLLLVSGSMLKVKRANTRGVAIAVALALFITLSAVAGYIYALEKPGSLTKYKWIVIYWAFRLAAMALIALQSFFAFRLVHLAQHLKAHVQARIMMWLLVSLSFYFVVCDLLATLVTGSLQVGLEWIPIFLQEIAELILWVALSYTIRSAVMILEPELSATRLFI